MSITDLTGRPLTDPLYSMVLVCYVGGKQRGLCDPAVDGACREKVEAGAGKLIFCFDSVIGKENQLLNTINLSAAAI